MIPCPKCGHENLPSYSTCSRCMGPLGGSGPLPAASGPGLGGGAAAAAQQDYQRLLAERAQTTRRNRMISFGVALAALAFFGYRWVQGSRVRGEAQAKLDYASRWVDLEKGETGMFWNCVMASEVDVGLFSSAGQIQQRLEAAYATQQKTFSEHLLTECIPKMERARQAFAGMDTPPEELRVPLESYKASLPELQKGVELYAERIRSRGTTKDVDQLIQEFGDAWHSELRPTEQTVAFEKFIHCAVPGLDKMKDAQEMLEYLADVCFKKDPVSFMDRVRKDCGPLLSSPDSMATPSKTYKASHKRFYEDERRQLSAWDSCGRRARKGKKVDDLGEFLVAVGEYMTARSSFVEAARGVTEKK
jgi:hypothetical protein